MAKTEKRQLEYAEKYLAKFDTCTARLPIGTKKRIAALGYSVNEFMKEAVLERLEQEEAYRKKYGQS